MRKSQIMDEAAITRALARMTHEIIERNSGAENLCILGVKTRGVPLAARIASNIEKFEGINVPVGILDITHHRDDMSAVEKQSKATGSFFPCSLEGKKTIIVDDVMYTGRTARAAIECVFSHSRPNSVQLAVLIDRGHRELPIRPDYVGKNVPTATSEQVKVDLTETDGQTGVFITSEG